MMTKTFQKLIKIMDILAKYLGIIVSKIEDQYDRKFKYIAQTILVIGLALIIFSPVIVYLTLISLQLQPPYCYIGFASWFAYIVLIILTGLYVEYGRLRDLTKSLIKENRIEIAACLEEYLKLLARREKRKKGRFKTY